jgi:Cu2+-exporting ATPase
MIAKAIVNFAQCYSLTRSELNNTDELEQIKVISGSGISASYQGKQLAIGSLTWMRQIAGDSAIWSQLEQQVQEYHLSGSTVVYAWLENESICAYVVEDKVRDNAVDIIAQMKAQNFSVTLLSGDKQEVADYMADKLGIDEVIAEVMPDEKDNVIKQKQQQGHLIAMVGDGINDAPALVRADVGIAMGSGTDVSIDSADIILVNGELEKIPLAAELSRATLKTIKQNIGISIVYNIIMVPLAMAAMITPLVAAIAMPLSSLLVIGNAARLRWRFKNK